MAKLHGNANRTARFLPLFALGAHFSLNGFCRVFDRAADHEIIQLLAGLEGRSKPAVGERIIGI